MTVLVGKMIGLDATVTTPVATGERRHKARH
jgi:hypothetical protein